MSKPEPTVLIATVGTGRTGDDIAAAIALSFDKSSAQQAVLLCSEKTQEGTLPKIKARLPEGTVCANTCPAGMENDVQGLFLYWNRRWDEWMADLTPARVVVDFTSGTKPMSAAAFALAIARNAENVSYVLGPRDETGRAVTSTEVKSFKPDMVLAHRQLRIAAEHFNVGAYAAARDIAARYLRADALPDDDLREKARGTHYLAAAYEAWDRFDWKHAAAHFHQVASAWQGWGWVSTPEQIHANYELIRAIRGSDNQDFPTCLLADLLANVGRCMARSAWDDAVARLYRACEMIAQKQLREQWGLKTNNIDPDKLPAPLRDKYAARRDAADRGKLQLGLREAYALLQKLGDPLGTEFHARYGETGQGDLANLLGARNQSLLAHGKAPIREDKARQLEAHVHALARIEWQADLDAYLAQAQSVRLDIR